MLRVRGLVCRVLRPRFVVPAGTILLLALGAASAQTASFSGVQTTIASGLNEPFAIAVSGAGPEAGDVFVANAGSNTVSVINPATNTVVATVNVGTAPEGIAVSGTGPEAGDVFVANAGSNTVSVINPATNTIVDTVSVGTAPARIAVSGAGPEAGDVFVAIAGSNTVWIINPATNNSVIVPVGTVPDGIAVSGAGPEAGDVFVANAGSNTVSVINLATFTVVATVLVGTAPDTIAVDGSGNVFVANADSNTVSVIDPATDTVVATVPVGTAPEGIAVDGSGNFFVANEASGNVLKETLSGVNFGAVAVGTPSAVQTLTFTFSMGGNIEAPVVLTQGATKDAQGHPLDFNAAATQESNACNATTTYEAGETCTVDVIFTPTRAGTRYGAVTLLNTSGAVIATAYFFGTGEGPQINYLPGVQTTLSSSFNAPACVAVDGNGNVFVPNYSGNTVQEIMAVGGSIPASPTIRTLGSGFDAPECVAVDGGGNVFVTNQKNNTVQEMVAVGGSIPTTNPTILTLGSGFSDPRGIAVDGSGNVFVTNEDGNTVQEIVAVDGSIPASNPTILTLGSGFSDTVGVAVDGNGNVFVANGIGNTVQEIVAVDGSIPASNPTILTLGSGFNNPFDVTVDGKGNVYVSNLGNNTVQEIVAVNGSIPASDPTILTLGSSFNEPSGVAVDGRGNVYVSNWGNNAVDELDFADAPTLTFATPTSDGTTDAADGALSVQIENIGNEPLTAVTPGLSVAANFTQVDGSGTPADCTVAFSLAVNASCNISVEFAPVAPASGTVSGSVVLTDNNLNATPSTTQTISLVGTAMVTTITISPTTLPSATVGVAYNQTITAGGGTAPYRYSISAGVLPAGITLTSGGVLAGTSTASGTFNFTVTATDSSATPGPYSGTASYSLAVNAPMVSAPTITISPAALPSAVAGTAYSATLTASGGTAPYKYAISAGAPPAGITLSTGGVFAGTPTASGTFNFTVIATDSSAAPGPYTGTESYSLLVNAAAVTVPLNFTFANTGTAAYTAAPGAVATYSFSLSPLNGAYPGAVSFNVTGLPTGAMASFTPNSVTANGGATPVTMTVQTAAATAQNRGLLLGRGIVMALLFLPFLGTRKVREKLQGKMLLLVLLIAGLTATLSGCASNNGFLLQKPQTFTLTVTATSGTVQNSKAVTLIVQ